MRMMEFPANLGPLGRLLIGFDRLFEDALRFESEDNYPPYNIEKTGEESYRLTFAVAGFSPEELSVTWQPNTLIVAGRKAEKSEGHYLHRGIAARAFEKQFSLADHVEVKEARLENGMLVIDLVRNVPEALKPRRIAISAPSAMPPQLESNKRLENQKEAA
jgi:molecular chaperone IbpA